jgi:hypothetical protein
MRYKPFGQKSIGPSARARTGSIILMVLFILVVAVMLAATFISMMASYRASGTQQTARQLADQVAVAGTIYAQQALMQDYAAALSANVPQRYNDVVPNLGYTYAADVTTSSLKKRPVPDAYPGKIPAVRTGLDWSLVFQGRVESFADATGTISAIFGNDEDVGGDGGVNSSCRMTQFQVADNQYIWWNGYWDNYASNIGGIRTDSTRPARVDSMEKSHDVALQYFNWESSWYTMRLSTQNGTTGSAVAGVHESYISPFSGRFLARPRWWTAGYYDADFQPLTWSDRENAAYEARFSVQPVPLDGCININFSDSIRQSTTGGWFYLQTRASGIPSVATTNWTAAVNVPLSQQYAASLYNFLGANSIYNGTDTVNNVPSLRLSTRILNTALGFGYRGNIYGYNSTTQNYTTPTGVPGLQVGPPASWRQLHANLTFSDNYGGEASSIAQSEQRELPITCLAMTPFGNGLSTSLAPDCNLKNGSNADLDCPWYVNVMTMTQITAKGMICGMDKSFYSIIYDNNATPTNCEISIKNVDEWTAQKSDLLPTPPDKVDPTDTAKVAKWDDGVARTGADGVEGGAIPPIIAIPEPFTPAKNSRYDWGETFTDSNSDTIRQTTEAYTDALPTVWEEGCDSGDTNGDGIYGPMTVLSTSYRRPPRSNGRQAGGTFNGEGDYDEYYFADDAFAGKAVFVWKNPVRDELITWSNSSSSTSYSRGSPYKRCARYIWQYTPALAGATLQQGMDYLYGTYIVPGWSDPTSGEDQIGRLVIGGPPDSSLTVFNRPAAGSSPPSYPTSTTALMTAVVTTNETPLDNNTDTVDERLSYQLDIVAALLKTLVDCHYDRQHGKKINGTNATHGYALIEDVETVFLAYLGIAVRYNPADGLSHASTVAASASDYTIWSATNAAHAPAGIPVQAPAPTAAKPATTAWVLGGMNQLQALSRLTSSGVAAGTEDDIHRNEIGYDRGHNINRYAGTDVTDPLLVAPYAALTFNANGINTSGNAGQWGYRNWKATDAGTYGVKAWPAGYQPTWAALSRVLEHRLNDVRMSLFGTPALDLNQDGLVDATVWGMLNTGGPYSGADFRAGVVTNSSFDPTNHANGVQIHFSATGRLCLGRNHYWRIFVRSQLWDRRADKLAAQSGLEQVTVMDPNGDGNLSDTHVLMNHPHGNPINSGFAGPTAAGRTEAMFP